MSEDNFPQALSMSDEDSESLMRWGAIDFKLMVDQAMVTPKTKTVLAPNLAVGYGFKTQVVEKSEDELDRDRMAMVKFMSMGAQRNMQRHAEAWGPILIAMMVQAGVLNPMEDPGERLREIIDDVLFLGPLFEEQAAKKTAKKKAKAK